MGEHSPEDLERWVLARLAELSGRDASDLDPTVPFASSGLRSVDAVNLVGRLETLLGRPLSEATVYDWPTPRELAIGLATGIAPRGPTAGGDRGGPDTGSSIAITGMACRFPGGADTPEKFWDLLAAGRDTVADAPVTRWPTLSVEPFPGAFLDDIAGWDAAFFGLSPGEALRLDPQHRLLTEVVWEALEDAGRAPDRLTGSRTGVFAGLMDSQHYARLQIDLDPACTTDPGFGLGSSPAAAAGRIAHLLDLRGPALVVDTACSSSLVALHLAVRALHAGDCDLAVVGGMSAVCHPQLHETARCMSMLSADGRCKTFDASADGFVIGEGGGAVVLERLHDAVRDRHRVRALLRGTAVNQDGRSTGLTAPNRSAQAALVRDALRAADVTADEVGFVETHGSGTRLGDTVELEALQEVFADRTDAPLLAGAVKTNVGHLLAAAGMAGLVKTVLAVERRTLPGNLNLGVPAPVLTRTPALRPPAGAQRLVPRPGHDTVLAGVSSFGWSGTNAHAVVEEFPATPADPTTGPVVLPLSAAGRVALRRLAGELAAFLADRPDLRPADVARTLREGRSRLRFRRALVCADLPDAVAQLTALAEDDEAGRDTAGLGPGGLRVVFDFPAGTGLSRASLRRAYAEAPAFRSAADACARELDDDLASEVFALWSPGPADAEPSAAARQAHDRCSQRALAGALRSWGVVPVAVRGEWAGEPSAGSSTPDRPPAVTEAGTVVLRFGTNGPGGGVIDLSGLDAIHSGHSLLVPPAARLWEAGWEPDWEALGEPAGRVVSLPHTPFQRRPLWPRQVTPSSDRRPPHEWCYTPTWQPAPLPDRLLPPGTAVVFADDRGTGEALGRALTADGHRVVTVTPGTSFHRTADRVTLDVGDPAHYRELLAAVLDATGRADPIRIVHLWCLRRHDGPDEALRWGFHSVVPLVQAIGTAAPRRDVSLLVVTAGARAVAATDATTPELATVEGLCRAVGQEYDRIRCRAVDLDPALPDAGELRRELAALEPSTTGSLPGTAWRDGERWEREWTPVALPAEGSGGPGWRPDGAYLITGGTRGLGMALARHLARTGPRRLALVARTPLPPRTRWRAVAGDRDRLARTCRDLVELEDWGATVLTITADAGDPRQLREAVGQARKRFGVLHGVVHAAGQPGSGLVQGMSPDRADAVLRPKVHGTAALLAELPELELLVLYSSAVTAVGGVGEGDYCAANAFLDACASAADRAPGSRLVSVAWGPWQHDDWARGDTAVRAAVAEYRSRYGIGAEEGPELLTAILRSPLREVLVLPQPLDRARRWWADPGGTRRASPPAPDSSAPAHPRPELRATYLEPRPGLELRIARAWQEHLGIDRIGSADPFVELGGNSLLATVIASRLAAELGVDVPPAMLFAHPTVGDLARALDDAPTGPPTGATRGARRHDRTAAAGRRRRTR